MSDSIPPFKEETQSLPPRAPSKRGLAIGFAVGAIPWLAALIPQKDYNQIGWLVLACFGAPLVATILAVIRRTRQLGLGALLACGLGWLVLGAICGGLFNRPNPPRPAPVEQKSPTESGKNSQSK